MLAFASTPFFLQFFIMVYKMLKIIFVVIFLFTSHVYADAAEKLEQLKSISNAGAPFLTLKMLDQAQPNLDADLYNWILWEQERYKILEQWQQWDSILIRIEGLPDDLPEPFKHQLATQHAQAYLNLKQTKTAREIIRPYLWNIDASSSLEYERWRKIIVDSYIEDGRFDDARIAMRRFSQDFSSQDNVWLETRALILIQSGHLEEAAEVLLDNNDATLKGLSLMVDLQSEKKQAKSVWLESMALAKASSALSKDSAIYWIVALNAAKGLSAVNQVVATEAVLKTSFVHINELLKVDADALWLAYSEYAQLVGNRAELLQGDDASWLRLAENSTKLTPIKARSLLAHIIVTGQNADIIELAAQTYLKTLDLEKQSTTNLLNSLFSQHGQFSDVSKIPVSIRFELVDLALKNADIETATRLMSGLDEHPKNTDLFAWQLRRARVLVLGGQIVEGHQVISQLLTDYQSATTQNTDRIIQVLFDLQTIGAHKEAIINFNQLLGLAIEPRQKREILFWIADSYKALKQHNKAALLYLKSALYAGQKAMDPWAQTARFSAAESLEKAGLIDDSRRILEGLLKAATKASQKASLRHKIQQLWLNQVK